MWHPLLLQFFPLYDQILNSSYKFCFPLSVLQTDIKIVYFFNEVMSSSKELHCTYSSGYNFILEKSCQKLRVFIFLQTAEIITVLLIYFQNFSIK